MGTDDNIGGRRPYTFDRVVRILFSVVSLIAVLYLLDVLKGVLLPFLVACLIAYMLEPLVQWNMRWLHLRKRFVPVVITLLEACILLGGFLALFIPYMAGECSQMAEMVRKYATTQVQLPYISDEIHRFIRDNIDFDQVMRLLSRDEWKSLLRTTISSSWNFLTSGVALVAGAVSWLIVLLYVVFIMLDYERLMLSFRQLVPQAQRRRVYRIFSDIKDAMNHYFRGQALISFLVGVLNLVPYLQLISLPVTTLLCLVWCVSSGGNFWLIFWEAMAVYVVVQCIQDLFLTPKIMGKAMGLNPAIILLSLSIWGCLLGFMGLIIALPLTTLLLSYYNMYVVERGE